MKSLKLSSSEMTAMKQFYEQELHKTITRLEHINEVLSKIDPASSKLVINYQEGAASVSTLSNHVDQGEVATSSGTGSLAQKVKSQQKSTSSKGRKKRGRKSVWGKFIVDYLKKQDRPVTYDELINTAMTKFGLPKSKEKSVDQAIRNSSFRLRKTNKKIETFSVDNSKEKFLALKNWFDKDNNLKIEYENKLPEEV